MLFDLAAGLAPRPVAFVLAGRDWTIPARPAADWLAALASPEPDLRAIVPGMVDDGDLAGLLDDDLYAAVMDANAAQWEADRLEAARDVLEVAAGCRWWIAVNLAALACNWESVGADMVLAGVDYQRLPLAAVLAAVRRHLERGSGDKWPGLQAHLESPPAEALDDAAADEGGAFLAVMSADGAR